MVDVYDWPQSLIPWNQVFHVPGQAVDGGFTTGGARTFSPEPGGRAILEWTFNPQQSVSAPRMFSWLLSKVANGAVFRLRLLPSAQTIDGADLGFDVPPSYDGLGIPWEGDIYWDNGFGWDVEYGAPVGAAGVEGSTTLVVNFGTLDRSLGHGHVIGVGGAAYVVDDIAYIGSVATITVAPPLRTNASIGDFVTFRPTFLGVCTDPSAFKAMFDVSGIIRPGSITFAEAIL